MWSFVLVLTAFNRVRIKIMSLKCKSQLVIQSTQGKLSYQCQIFDNWKFKQRYLSHVESWYLGMIFVIFGVFHNVISDQGSRPAKWGHPSEILNPCRKKRENTFRQQRFLLFRENDIMELPIMCFYHYFSRLSSWLWNWWVKTIMCFRFHIRGLGSRQ